MLRMRSPSVRAVDASGWCLSFGQLHRRVVVAVVVAVVVVVVVC